MKLSNAALFVVAMSQVACATTTETPLNSASMRDDLSLGDVSVSYAQDRNIPNIYDKSIARALDKRTSTTLDYDAFEAYVADKGGRGEEDDQLAERYLEFRIAEEIRSRVGNNLRGSRDVDIDIEIKKTITPNAATMLLVGEIKSITYDMDVSDVQTDSVLVEFSEPSSPQVEVTSGGGLLGLGVRAYGTQSRGSSIVDLEGMVEAVASEVTQIMTGSEVNKTVAKKLKSTL